jgi:hypothetical protein
MMKLPADVDYSKSASGEKARKLVKKQRGKVEPTPRSEAITVVKLTPVFDEAIVSMPNVANKDLGVRCIAYVARELARLGYVLERRHYGMIAAVWKEYTLLPMGSAQRRHARMNRKFEGKLRDVVTVPVLHQFAKALRIVRK